MIYLMFYTTSLVVACCLLSGFRERYCRAYGYYPDPLRFGFIHFVVALVPFGIMVGLFWIGRLYEAGIAR